MKQFSLSAFVKKVWATDQSTTFKVCDWISAIGVWQLSDSNSYFRAKYNAYKFEQALAKSEESVNSITDSKDKSKIQGEIAKMKANEYTK